MIHVLTTWMLPQRLGRAERTVSPDKSWKVKPSIVPSILNPDWSNCLVKRRCMVILETQYTSYSLEIAVLVVLSLGSMISCSISIDRQPDRKERSQEKQSSSMTWQLR